jgi:quercetin dioxygenase-like cupin family protein
MTDNKRHTLHEDDAQLAQLKGRSYKLIVGSEELPSMRFNGGVSFFPPHAHAPGHVHDTEEEVIYVLEGTGETVIDGVAEELRPGTFCIFPMGCLHSINNTGNNAIKLLYLFTPPADIGNYPNVDMTEGK